MTDQPDWWLDERVHAGAEHLNPSYVAGYERKAGHDPAEELALLRRHGLDGDSTLVDLGAGTGRFAVAAAATCARVVAVELSPPMLDRIGAAVTRAGATNIEIVPAGFLSYRHTGPPADVVYSRHALHQLPDFWKAVALSRIATILRPGGVLYLRDLVYDFDPAQAGERIETWLAGASPTPETGWTRAELAEHVRGEHSTFRWLLEPMLERTGFTIVEADPAGHPGVYAAYLCVRG
nr:methyltransferase domain-containing protein [Micromonospora sp. DSM 115978]